LRLGAVIAVLEPEPEAQPEAKRQRQNEDGGGDGYDDPWAVLQHLAMHFIYRVSGERTNGRTVVKGEDGVQL
jgi:hypothetical protein